MAEINRKTIETMTAALARNVLQFYETQFDAPLIATPFEGEFIQTLAPGVAAFVGRLSAALPGNDNGLGSILEAFFNDPALARAFIGPASDEGLLTAVEVFIAAGGDRIGLGRRDFEEALAMLLAARAEAVRPRLGLGVDSADNLIRLAATYSRPSEPDWLRAAAAEFVRALLERGLSRIEDGRAFAADGVTVIFVWDSGRTGAKMGNGGGEETAAESAGPGIDEALEAIDEPPAEGLVGEASEAVREEAPLAPPPPPAVVPDMPSTTPPLASVVALRLDAALPERVIVGRAFDLAVAIRRAGSPPAAVDDLARRESADFGAVWPAGAVFIQLRIQISAPDCDIHGGDSRSVRLLAGTDGPPVYFQLTPRGVGPLSVIITVYQEADWVGSTRLRTEARPGEARGGLAMTVESRPLGDDEVNLLTLRTALDDGYNDSELRDLCFELGIDYEDLPGDNQSAKARELVLFAKRRGQLAQLVERVMKERPHLLVPA